jgi:TolA-binding protein
MGRAYYNMGQRWESTAAYDEVVRVYPTAQEREAALFGVVVNLAELNRATSAQKRGEDYLKEFRKEPNAATVGYLMGATALQANDPQGAESYFGRVLQDLPDNELKAEILFQLGNARFGQGKYEEAIQDYQRYRAEYSKGSHTEDAAYRIAVGLVFAGKYEEAMPALNSYLQTFANGTYAPDVRYRLALCYYAASHHEETVSCCREWEKQYGQDPQLGEVLALLADALTAQGAVDEAVETYIRSYKSATTDEVLNYSLFEAQKALQMKGDWTHISSLFEDFIQAHSEHPLVPTAMYWIARAKAREGKTEEARQFCADTIRRYIDDPKREAVELLLSQLAQLCARRPRSMVAVAVASDPTSNAKGAAAGEASKSEPDPAAELDRLLGTLDSPSLAAQARMLFAKSELAQSLRKPEEQKKYLFTIGTDFTPEALSPALLARSADNLLESGATEKAESLFRYLLDTYPKSAVADYASQGLGEIAYRKGDFVQALRLFSAPIDNGTANQKLKELTLGRAKTLLRLDRLEEAQKAFEQVASVREWRCEATAQAVYSLGEIEFRRGKWAEANAFYQRVFVGYQKFLPWVARAYLQSGECFQKLGKGQEAARTYQEMLHNEKLSQFEEVLEARKRLQGLTEGKNG